MIKIRVAINGESRSAVRFFNSSNVPLSSIEVRSYKDFELEYDSCLSKKQRRNALKLITAEKKGVTVFPRTIHDRAAKLKGYNFDIDTNTDYVKVRMKKDGVVIDRVIVTRQGRLRGKVEKAKEQMLMGAI